MSGDGKKGFGANVSKRVSCIRDPIITAFELNGWATIWRLQSGEKSLKQNELPTNRDIQKNAENFYLKTNQPFKSGSSVASKNLYFAQYTLLSRDALNVQVVQATKNYFVLNVVIPQEFDRKQYKRTQRKYFLPSCFTFLLK